MLYTALILFKCILLSQIGQIGLANRKQPYLTIQTLFSPPNPSHKPKRTPCMEHGINISEI